MLQPPTQSRANFKVRSGYSGPCAVYCWISLRVEIPQPLNNLLWCLSTLIGAFLPWFKLSSRSIEAFVPSVQTSRKVLLWFLACEPGIPRERRDCMLLPPSTPFTWSRRQVGHAVGWNSYMVLLPSAVRTDTAFWTCCWAFQALDLGLLLASWVTFSENVFRNRSKPALAPKLGERRWLASSGGSVLS